MLLMRVPVCIICVPWARSVWLAVYIHGIRRSAMRD